MTTQTLLFSSDGEDKSNPKNPSPPAKKQRPSGKRSKTDYWQRMKSRWLESCKRAGLISN